MDEREFTKALMATLSEAPGDYTSGEALDIEQVASVETYEEAGILTRDAGLVVTMADRTKFQNTIVRA